MGEYNANKTSKSWATWHFWKAREPDEYIFRHYLSYIRRQSSFDASGDHKMADR
jgi:hypothetical protein